MPGRRAERKRLLLEMETERADVQQQLLVIKEEIKEEATQFSLTPVQVKSEDDGATNSWTQHVKTEADGDTCGGAEPASDLDTPLLPDHQRPPRSESDTDDTDDSEDWRETSDSLESQEVQVSKKKDADFKSISCSGCGKKLSSMSAHTNHVKSCRGPLTCSVCGKCFEKQRNLKAHLKIHSGEKPFVCPPYGKCFAAQGTLKRHLRYHSVEKPFRCSQCNKCFKARGILKSHLRFHSGEKPFCCTQCDKRFTRRGTMVAHLRRHNGGRPYIDSQCGKCFAERRRLSAHSRIHTGQKPLPCSECGKRFAEKSQRQAKAIKQSGLSRLQHFSKLDFQSKRKVISEGRPTPELKGLIQTTGQTSRSFQTEWYKRKDWLCGCPARNRLYCFPCLLFSSGDNVWTNAGYCDLKNLQRSLGKHESSARHIQCQISLKTFGNSRIDLALDEQQRLNVSVHNAKVRENREILKDLINATCFLAKQELAFRGNDERVSSSNRGNYVELLHAFAEKDERLARHLETSAVFSGLSNKIQSDLIEAVGDVIRKDIKKEIDAAPFVAVEVDETTDVTNKARISVILRYVTLSEHCEVKEAFLGFDDVSDDRRAPAIAACVLRVLEEYGCVEKLVAQTYDGAAVRASELNGVQATIKEKVPEAMFTHCYAHQLNLVLMHSAMCMPESRSFFKTVEGLGTFFRKSTKHAHLLDDVVKRRLPRAAPTRWSSNSRMLQTISKYLSDLRAVFRVIGENPDSWDNETLMMAAGYDRWLSKTSTCFFLMAYEGIFMETDALFKVLQSKVMDVGYCCARIRDTVSVIERMRQEFDLFYEKYEQKCMTLGLTDGDRKQPVRDEKKRTYDNILDNVSVQMKARFDHFGELAFLGLVDCTRFHEMSRRFDDTKLQSLSKYARFFDFVRLKADLVGLYSSPAVGTACQSPGQLLSFLAQKDLIQTVPEATKLLQLALTLPATTASVDRSFSALNRLKTYSRNKTGQGRLSSLAIISIEAERLLKLRENKDDFYNQVIERFVEKDRRMDFIYK